MLKRDFAVYRTTNDTVLINRPVPPEYIERAVMLGVTRFTLWHQPNACRMRDVTQAHVVCCMCQAEYANGTNVGYLSCWLPLTWFGVHERLMHIARVIDRNGELWAMYGIDMVGLQAELAKPG